MLGKNDFCYSLLSSKWITFVCDNGCCFVNSQVWFNETWTAMSKPTTGISEVENSDITNNDIKLPALNADYIQSCIYFVRGNYRTFPRRFHVSTYNRRVQWLEMLKWHFKLGRWQKSLAACIYRTRDSHVGRAAAKWSGNKGKCSYYACFCSHASLSFC